LRPLDPEAPVFGLLVGVFKELGMAVQTYFRFGNWYLDVGDRSYAEYVKTLPSVLRKNIPYEIRKLEKFGRLRFEMVTEEQSLERALDDYEEVYQASWREAEPYPAFIRGLARVAVRSGWLRLGLMYLNEEPAAAQIWIVHAGVASIYKIAYKEKFGKLSVGKILTARLLEHVIDIDKVKQVDYLSGDDQYKKDWMSHRRERWGLMVANPYHIRGMAQAAQNFASRLKKGVMDKIWRD
jgi:CelD/BcsL family acetyltransferase involved in cellulose biosynthesis